MNQLRNFLLILLCLPLLSSCTQPNLRAEASCKDQTPTVVFRDPPPRKADVTYRKISIPAYPPRALADRITGVVVLHVWVRKDRSLSKVAVQSIYPSSAAVLSEGLVDKIRSWQFNPAEAFGNPIDGEVLVPVKFSIRGYSPPPEVEQRPSLPEGVYLLDTIDVEESIR